MKPGHRTRVGLGLGLRLGLELGLGYLTRKPPPDQGERTSHSVLKVRPASHRYRFYNYTT